MRSLVLYSAKAGPNKTALLFNVAHMLARSGATTVILDCDPQSEVSAFALGEEKLFDVWQHGNHETVAQCIEPILREAGELQEPRLREVADRLWMLPGDLKLGQFEQRLASSWHRPSNDVATVPAVTALMRLSHLAAEQVDADVVLIDVAAGFGSLNRAALLAADVLITPVTPDLFGLEGLKAIGATIREWRSDSVGAFQHLPWPPAWHQFEPRGYIVQHEPARVDGPNRSEQWAKKIPDVFHEAFFETPPVQRPESIDTDPYCLATLKTFASLSPFAQQARKPIFDLKPADGIGMGQMQVVARARREFESLGEKLLAILDLG